MKLDYISGKVRKNTSQYTHSIDKSKSVSAAERKMNKISGEIIAGMAIKKYY